MGLTYPQALDRLHETAYQAWNNGIEKGTLLFETADSIQKRPRTITDTANWGMVYVRMPPESTVQVGWSADAGESLYEVSGILTIRVYTAPYERTLLKERISQDIIDYLRRESKSDSEDLRFYGISMEVQTADVTFGGWVQSAVTSRFQYYSTTT